MHFYDGGGCEYYGGEWSIKETDKQYIFELVNDVRDYGNINKLERIKKDNTSKSIVKVWGDDTFTVYPNRNGVPHVFEPLTAARLELDFDLEQS